MASRVSGSTDGFEGYGEVGTDELCLPLEFGSSFPPLFSAVSIGASSSWTVDGIIPGNRGYPDINGGQAPSRW
jgi:hypothetical protein